MLRFIHAPFSDSSPFIKHSSLTPNVSDEMKA